MDVQDRNNQLHWGIRFTDDDLVANRDGKLSASQYSKLARQRNTAAITTILMFIMGVFLIAAGSFIPRNFIPVALVCSLIPIVLLIRSLNSWLQTNRDLKEMRVYLVMGSVTCKILWSASEDSRASYYLNVDNMKFGVSQKVYAAFKDGWRYRIYYLPNTKTIVSAESLQ